MRHIRHELPQSRIHLPRLGQVMQCQQYPPRPVRAQRRSDGLQEPALRQQLRLRLAYPPRRQRQRRRLLYLMIPQSRRQSPTDRLPLAYPQHNLRRAIHQRNSPLRVSHDHAIFHSIQHSRQLSAFVSHILQDAPDSACHSIERLGQFARFVLRRRSSDPMLQIPLRQTPSPLCHRPNRPRRPVKQDVSRAHRQHSHHQRRQRDSRDNAIDIRLNPRRRHANPSRPQRRAIPRRDSRRPRDNIPPI